MFHVKNQRWSNWDYVTCSEVSKLIEDKIKTAVEVATRCTVTGIVEKTTEDIFKVGHNERMKWMKTPIRNMLEETLIDIVKQGDLEIILGHNVNKLTKYIRSRDVMTQWVARNSFFITPITIFVKKDIERILQEVRLEKALKQELINSERMQTFSLSSSLMSQEIQVYLHTPSEPSASSDSIDKKKKTGGKSGSRIRYKIAWRDRPPFLWKVASVVTRKRKPKLHRGLDVELKVSHRTD